MRKEWRKESAHSCFLPHLWSSGPYNVILAGKLNTYKIWETTIFYDSYKQKYITSLIVALVIIFKRRGKIFPLQEENAHFCFSPCLWFGGPCNLILAGKLKSYIIWVTAILDHSYKQSYIINLIVNCYNYF